MSNFDTVVLDGEMGLFTKVRDGDLPYYTGATEVTPSDSTQVLETADTIVTENITINPIPDMDLETVQVTYTPDEEGQTDTITPSTGYVGIAEVEVTVEPIDSNYVGSGIARNDSDDLTVSGTTVTVPSGYYAESASKSVASGSAATPATTITANPTISVGNDGSITASVSATQSVTPTVSAGYVSSGTAGTITVSGSGSSQLSTQAAATITPTTSQQTAVAAGKFTTGAVIVDAMPSGTAGTPTATKGTVSNHSVSVTPSVTNQTGYITGGTKTGTAVTVSASELVSGTKSITANGTNIDVTEYAAVDVAVPGDTPTLQTKSVSYTPTESQQTETVTPSTGYDGLDKVNVTVGAIDSEYVGSDVPRRSSSDLSASGATVTAPAGYYAAAASKAVASGTAGTPSATKGAVSNHSISVTPSVTNTAGYIPGGTISGTAVSVSASELVSGTLSITDNGTGIDVTNYAAVDVSVSGGGGDTTWVTGVFNGDLTYTETLLGSAFSNATGDFTLTMPNLITIRDGYAFENATGLKAFHAPVCTSSISQYSFRGSYIETIFIPDAQLTTRAMSGASKLVTAVIKGFANNSYLEFENVPLLKTVDMLSNTYRCDNAWQTNCGNFDTLILRDDSQLLVMANATGLNGSKFKSGGAGGTIYIPETLYNHLGDGTSLDYKNATNWSTYDGYGTITWAAIEGSQYENYYADGTPIT